MSCSSMGEPHRDAPLDASPIESGKHLKLLDLFIVTAEGGVEGTQVIRYDAEGRPLDPNAVMAPIALVASTFSNPLTSVR